jgi:hypothetical protein
MMDQDMISEYDVLRRYLLGDLNLPDAAGRIDISQRDWIEEKLFSDDSFVDRLSVAEDDLIDEYLRRELPRRDRQQFERVFLQSERRRERLELARRIHSRLFAAPADQSITEKLRSWFAGFYAPPPKFALAAAGAIVISAAFGSWWVLRSQSAAHQTISASLRRDLVAARARIDALDARVTELTPASSLSFALTPGLTRAVTVESRLAIPPGNHRVRLQLDTGSKAASLYRASVQQADGTEVWSRVGLKPELAETRHIVTLDIPSSVLPPSDYVVTLWGGSGSGYRDELADYSFRVVRP